MKVTVEEFGGCFCISLKPETVEEVSRLVRMGMNRTKELRSCDTSANEDGTFYSSVVIGKSKKANNCIPNRK